VASSLNDNSRDIALDAIGTAAAYASVHNADPSTNGANEISGGSPAYARKSIAFDSASGSSMAVTSDVVFDIPAGETVAFIGLWSASTAGTFYGAFDVTDEAFAGQGQYTFTASGSSISASG
jgi:hypothetical protein